MKRVVKKKPVARTKTVRVVKAKASVDLETDRKKKMLRLLELEKAQEKDLALLKEYEDTHKIEFFKPFVHQGQFVCFVRDGKKTVLLVGANQIGKTVVCAVVAGSFSLGCESPWDKLPMFASDFAKANKGRGVVGRILCNDWEKAARDTIVPKLKEWLPAGSYETKKNNVGVEHEFTFPKTGSKFTILTYKEDTKSHEGWTGDWIFADEPPPRDKYVANRRGLVARNGIFLMAMTAISEPWILDEIVDNPDVSTGIVADIPIEANTTLTSEAIRIFESSLTDDEKIARIKGGWLQLTGRVWKAFRINDTFNAETQRAQLGHVREYKPLPIDWPCEFQIDFHLNLPHAVLFTACDPWGILHSFYEVWANMGSEELAYEIVRIKKTMGLRMSYGEIDPLSKGDTSYFNNRFGKVEDSYSIIRRILQHHGIRLGVGSKDEKSYIKAVETRLKGPNGIPIWYIYDNCKEAIKQIQRWSYDDNGKPKDDGHFPECLGRQTQTGLKWTDPQVFNQPLKLASCPI